MSAPIAPTIPPRPNRNHDLKPPTPAPNAPTIPPRPQNRRADRSVSPGLDNYARSPLNETPFASNLSRHTSNMTLPPRPPSVTLPSLGQEGNEYADLEYENEDPDEGLTQQITPAAEQTRQIGSDLHLHAPKPSLPKSSAKAQVQTVTRTDSGTAAALGYGKPQTPVHDEEPLGKRLSHISRPDSSASTQRRQSMQFEDDEHGIPEIGQRVPMYPNAGDVQAPSPAPFASMPSTGVGFHNNNGGQRPRHHTRTKSGNLPPGSYGLHGHGVEPADKFEKAWYDKHPEARHEEHGQYGPGLTGGRGEYSLSSEDLNKIVRSTSKSVGPSNLSSTVAYPDEQIGYMATDEYTSRMASPNPPTPGLSTGRHRGSSQTAIESPLRRTNFPADVMDSGKMEKSAETIKSSDQGLESEGDDYIHVDEPGHKSSKIGPGFHDAPTEDLGPNGGNTADEGGWIDERGYGVPILASDEVAKEAGAEYMQPAISPYQERRGSSTFFHPEGETPGCKSGDRTPSVSGSRPTSRPASIHGVGTSLARFASRNEEREDMHTPLENVEEYEPLFPDEEDESGNKPLNAADRFKMRPGTLKRRFPSQDIWEDAPNSLQHYATVSTPELPQPAKTFEKPETEAAREEEASEAERAKLMPKEERLSKSVFHPQLRDDMPTRPDMKQRFPSRDIWEDSPDSLHLVTTVSTPDVEEPRSPPIASKPTIPPRPTKSKLGEGSSEQGLPVQSQVPSRPPKRLHQVPPADAKLTTIENGAEKQVSPTEGRKAPIIPDRPKPQVPARPSKPKPTGSSEDLTKTTSAGSAGSVSPTITKAKPVVPARPTGSKIAALQAGFMTDLNKRLQIGPQAPKPVEREVEPEAEVEKVPLSDARKGRARGPVRRKPATEASPEKSVPKITISPPKMVWSIGEDGGVSMRQEEKAALKAVEEAKTARVESTTQPSEVPSGASALATNTAGDTVDPAPAPEKVEEPPAPVSEKSDVPVADQLRPDLATTSAASSTSKLFKTADQTPAEEIEDPLATVPTASHAAETTTTADNTLAATEPEPSPAAAPNPEESKAYISADSPEDAPEDLQRKPTIPREPSLPALATTLSGQKVDAGKASDALEMLDTGVQGGGVEGGEEKSAEEVDMMSHRGSVTIAETGSLARKPEGEA